MNKTKTINLSKTYDNKNASSKHTHKSAINKDLASSGKNDSHSDLTTELK